MSDTAQKLRNIAEITLKRNTMSWALQDRSSAGDNTLTEKPKTYLNQESVSSGIKARDLPLLAEGGYNYVWPVSYAATHCVGPPFLILYFDLIATKNPHQLRHTRSKMRWLS